MEDEVLAAAHRRAQALAAGDPEALRALHHPALRWLTHRGEVLDRDAYVAGNTRSDLVWRSQRLEDPQVAIAGDTAVLTATVVDEVERAGEPQTFRLALLQTWVREDGRWLCLAGSAVRP
jgi:ketosteroid isomerase-like protein